MRERPDPTFHSRWSITGTLTTLSPLHIGDGFSGELHDRSRPADKSKAEPEHDAQTVCVDHAGAAFLPGSVLRGVLRSSLGSRLSQEPWRQLFGDAKPDAPDAVGGKLIFYDSFISGEPLTRAEDPPHLPYWSAARLSCVATHVSIDRRTRTAADKLLFHTEYVPAGTSFAVEIGGEGLSDTEVSGLLSLFSGFSQHLRLGANTSNDWGRVEWKLSKVCRLDAARLDAWKKNRTGSVPKPLHYCEEKMGQFVKDAAKDLQIEYIEITIELSFPGPLLVRDPRQSERIQKVNKVARKSQLEAVKLPNAVPILNTDERPYLPSSALRGVLRSRLEMILRTLSLDEKVPEVDRLFGNTRFRAALRCGDFTLVKGAQPSFLLQEFVAIDRFTGSVAGKRKFDVKAVVDSELYGQLSVDLRNIDSQERSEVLRALALLLRDLMEGDLYFGSGAAKGYGHCAKANGRVGHEPLLDWIKDQLLPTAPHV